MLSKEQKWMNRLKKCLSDMPENCELLVNNLGDNKVTCSLLEKGTMDTQYDMMFLDTSDSELCNDFTARRVTACSENI
ncbi:hypothetical protein VPHK460_0188 [Vibrio phage K460]